DSFINPIDCNNLTDTSHTEREATQEYDHSLGSYDCVLKKEDRNVVSTFPNNKRSSVEFTFAQLIDDGEGDSTAGAKNMPERVSDVDAQEYQEPDSILKRVLNHQNSAVKTNFINKTDEYESNINTLEDTGTDEIRDSIYQGHDTSPKVIKGVTDSVDRATFISTIQNETDYSFIESESLGDLSNLKDRNIETGNDPMGDLYAGETPAENISQVGMPGDFSDMMNIVIGSNVRNEDVNDSSHGTKNVHDNKTSENMTGNSVKSESALSSNSEVETMEFTLNPSLILPYEDGNEECDSNSTSLHSKSVTDDGDLFVSVKTENTNSTETENIKVEQIPLDTGITGSEAESNENYRAWKRPSEEPEDSKEASVSATTYKCNFCWKRYKHKANCIRHEATHSGKKSFPCSICGKEFSRENNLNAHKRIHTEEKSFKCEICGKGFYWKSCLTRHMEAHRNKEDFTCNVCGKTFVNKPYLADHMVVHTREKLFKCEICAKTFSFNLSLKKHMILHTNKKEYVCDICGKEYFHKSGLKLHMVKHTVEKELKCFLCGTLFSSISLLSEHMALHTKEFECKICGVLFTSKSLLFDHVTMHTGILRCEICEETFPDSESLVQHRTLHHSFTHSEKEFTENSMSEISCDKINVKVEEGSVPYESIGIECIVKKEEADIPSDSIKVEDGIVSSNNAYMGTDVNGLNTNNAEGSLGQENLNLITGTNCTSVNTQGAFPAENVTNQDLNSQSERRFQCSICGKRFHSRANLLRHEVVHSGVKMFQCTICGKQFSREYNLMTHSRMHTEEKNFKCDICGKGFYWKSCLSRHMGVHTDKDEYTCHVCGKTFFNKSYVIGHMVVHTKEKVFKCDICGKGFSFKVSLRKHKVMHTNVKDFKCDICGKEFFQKSNLNYHRLTHMHTQEKDIKCELCNETFLTRANLADHMALHNGIFKCEVCDETFSQSQALEEHRANHNLHGDTPLSQNIIKKTYPGLHCKICGKLFSRQDRLNEHMHVHQLLGETAPNSHTDEMVDNPSESNSSQMDDSNHTAENISVDDINVEKVEVGDETLAEENGKPKNSLRSVRKQSRTEKPDSRDKSARRYSPVAPRIQNGVMQGQHGHSTSSAGHAPSLPQGLAGIPSYSAEMPQNDATGQNVNYNLINQLLLIRYLRVMQGLQSGIVPQIPSYGYGSPLLLPEILAAAQLNALNQNTNYYTNADLPTSRSASVGEDNPPYNGDINSGSADQVLNKEQLESGNGVRDTNPVEEVFIPTAIKEEKDEDY
ncbi:hypothetical protein SK128_010072, partial [Halocaridina rubra]